MITDGKKWHYLGVKKFPALLRGVTFPVTQIVQKKKLKKHYEVCKNHDYCFVEMPKMIKY